MEYSLPAKPFSWSQMSSFEYSPEQWFRSYILGERQSSPEMDFGSMIDRKFQDDPSFFPEIPRGEHKQYKMQAVFSGIPLVGIPDIISFKDEFLLADLKTGKKPWMQQRADETGQLTFYAMLAYITKKIPPEKFRMCIYWLPTRATGDFKIELKDDRTFHSFETGRTMSDVLAFGQRIIRVRQEMREYLDGLSTA